MDYNSNTTLQCLVSSNTCTVWPNGINRETLFFFLFIAVRIYSGKLWLVIIVLSCLTPSEAATTNVLQLRELFEPVCDIRSDQNEKLVSHPKDNQFYWVCSNGTTYSKQCPSHYRFNVASGLCDSEIAVADNAPEGGQFLNDIDFECPPEGIHRFVLNGSCTGYHYCLNGRHSIRSCVQGLHFDEKVRNCNFIPLARCQRDWCPNKDPEDGSIVTFPSTDDCSK